MKEEMVCKLLFDHSHQMTNSLIIARYVKNVYEDLDHSHKNVQNIINYYRKSLLKTLNPTREEHVFKYTSKNRVVYTFSKRVAFFIILQCREEARDTLRSMENEVNKARFFTECLQSSFVKKQKDFHTYIASDGVYYKIGKAVNVDKRIRALKVANPNIGLVVHANTNIEALLHKRFKSKNVSGEWFDLTVADLEFIKELIKQRQTTAPVSPQ